MKVKIWGIFGAVVLVAALVVGLAGAVLADEITWYLNDTPSAAGCVMDKASPDYGPSTYVTVANGDNVIWIEDQAATSDILFPAATWKTDIFFESYPFGDMTVYIGWSTGDAGSFTSAGSTTFTANPAGTLPQHLSRRWQPEIVASAFTLSTGEYVAFKLVNNTDSPVNVDTAWNEQSRVSGPPGMPEVTEIEIEIDIKPTSCPNPLNVGSGGVLPVAILGTEEFDVAQVDPTTVELEGVSPSKLAFEDVATPDGLTDCGDAYACTTEGPDGYLDMTFKFKKKDVVDDAEALSGVSDGDVLCLTLTGNLKAEFGGTPIEGKDVVIILKKK